MVELRYLSVGKKMPEMAGDEPWLIIEASFDGRFFGSGWGASCLVKTCSTFPDQKTT
ncbi:hypothetical protein [Sphingosinicella sp.]|uniref:hypothetical protein n=1 Tax=Sphingosinicella sp. TaxID=1917971 RepID=UPI00262CCC3C|nr:hypothetical protein [Sphingosinicella sp.]